MMSFVLEPSSHCIAGELVPSILLKSVSILFRNNNTAVEGKNFLLQMEGILIVMLFMVVIHPEIIKEQTFENRQIQCKKRNAIFRQRRDYLQHTFMM